MLRRPRERGWDTMRIRPNTVRPAGRRDKAKTARAFIDEASTSCETGIGRRRQLPLDHSATPRLSTSREARSEDLPPELILGWRLGIRR